MKKKTNKYFNHTYHSVMDVQ